MAQNPAEGAPPLDAFLEALWRDLRDGCVKPLSDYLADHPGDDDAIARNYAEVMQPLARISIIPDAPPLHAPITTGTIGPYRLVRELGRGGQGVVFLAEDTRLFRNVAIKILTGSVAASPEALERFSREAAAAAKIDHPGICAVFDTGEAAGTRYIAMRYVEGATLAELIRRSTAVGPSARMVALPEACGPRGIVGVAAVVEEAACALHSAHVAGVIHRDVKPGNIMIDRDGRPTILDFGLARNFGGAFPTMTRPGDFFGTPAYMPPEQIRATGQPLDARADVYALGATLFECLTLRQPCKATTREGLLAELEAGPPDPSRVNAGIPRDLAVIVQTAMEPERRRRYQSALELANELRRFRLDEPILARPVSWPVRALRTARRRRAVAFAAIAFVGAVVAFLVWPRPVNVTLETALDEVSLEVTAAGGSDSTFVRHVTGGSTIELAPGPHEIVARKKNHLSRRRKLDVRSDGRTSLNVTLTPMLKWERTLDPFNSAGVRLSDFDEDGIPDLLIDGQKTRPGEGLRGLQFQAVSRRDVLWTADLAWTLSRESALLDWNRDGIDDVVFLAARPSQITVVSGRNGSTLWSQSLEAHPWRELQVRDLDGDGEREVVASAADGAIWTWSPSSMSSPWARRADSPAEKVLGTRVILGPGGRPAVLVATSTSEATDLAWLDGATGTPVASHRVAGSIQVLGPAMGDEVWLGTSDGRVDRVTARGPATIVAPKGEPLACILDAGTSIAERTVAAVFRSGAIMVVSGGAVQPIRRPLPAGRSVADAFVVMCHDADDPAIAMASFKDASGEARGGWIDWVPLGAGEQRTYERADDILLSLTTGDVDCDGSIETVAIESRQSVAGVATRATVLTHHDTGPLWRAATEGPVWSSPDIGDLTGDGCHDVVIGSRDHSVHALDGTDGRRVWKYATGGLVDSSPRLRDVNSDGVPDVFVGSDDHRLHAIDGRSGRALWPPLETDGAVESSPVLVEVAPGGPLRVIVASRGGSIYVLDAKTGALVREPIRPAGGNTEFYATPLVYPPPPQRPLSFALGGFDGVLHGFSLGDGREIFATPVSPGARIYSTAALARLNDRDPEVFLLGGGDGRLHAVSGTPGHPHLWGCPTPNRPVNSSPAIADLDGDGMQDAVVGGAEGHDKEPGHAVIAVNGRTRQRLWEFNTRDGTWSSPALSDLDGDGVSDAVIGSLDSYCYVLSGQDGRLLQRFATGGKIYSSPRITDFDGDGRPEIVFGCFDNCVYAFSAGPDVIRSSRRVPMLARTRAAFAAGAYEAVIAETREAGAEDGEARLLRSHALVMLHRREEAVAELDALVRAGMRTPRLGFLRLVCSTSATQIDPKVMAACVETDPTRFLELMAEGLEQRREVDRSFERAGLAAVLDLVATADHVDAAEAVAVLSILLDRPLPEERPPRRGVDAVRSDYEATLRSLAAVVEGSESGMVDRTSTDSGNRFSCLWRKDRAELRRLLRLSE